MFRNMITTPTNCSVLHRPSKKFCFGFCLIIIVCLVFYTQRVINTSEETYAQTSFSKERHLSTEYTALKDVYHSYVRDKTSNFEKNHSEFVAVASLGLTQQTQQPHRPTQLTQSITGTLNKARNTQSYLTLSNNNKFNDSLHIVKLLFNDNKTNSDTSTLEIEEYVELCQKSKYLECPIKKVKSFNRTFHISVANWPSWLPATVFQFSTCRHSNCVFDKVISQTTDVVLVHGVGLDDQMVPAKRWPHQTYGFVVWEPPGAMHAKFLKRNVSLWDNYFNFTVSYRTDSDIFNPYGKLKLNPKPLKERPNYLEIAKKKNKTAAWFVSNCYAPSKRLEYVREMQKYVDIDVLGKCGVKCEGEKINLCESFPENYKFYLSFESSFCDDYVTEKFFKVFEPDTHVVPVVRGTVDYDQSFPNGTFINAAHFQSPKDLALFLRQLASNLEAYSEVLKRKLDYVYHWQSHIDIACGVCDALNENPSLNKSINIRQWLNNKTCHSPTDI
ncbi:4-galactosyl-N-acetylglucosaminide 3-alpha-L-fucosyltransferase 9-like [Physella acuta]|uniref:4-galactosyl-N-acetylglucosaminide 3-alpha-L-fucosyltransferase 9-like n=1 Tax=Physella acuta TaxID=109671 RepID=UPI0027DAB702|nr:4-galactosyl-N-acetylglucosaminide 3-alpha-L-fucosyltransferase 9-like [Physella acuta]